MSRSTHGFVSDIHLWNFKLEGGATRAGINERFQLTLDVVDRAAGLVDYLHICGDVFHESEPTPQMLAALMRVFAAHLALGLTQVHIIPGNHDEVSSTADDHALGPLGMLPGVFVHDQPRVVKVGPLVPLTVFYCPFPYSPLDYHFTRAPAVVCMHRGITHEGTEAFLKPHGIDHNALREWMASHKKGQVQQLFAGDWHQPMSFGKTIHQLGCLAPADWRDHGINRGKMKIATVENGAVAKVRTVEIPGPRFIDAGNAAAATTRANDLVAQGHTPFIEYGRATLADGAADESEPVPAVPGAYFRPTTRAQFKALTEAEAEVASAAAQIKKSKNVLDLLENYLRTKYPTRWDKILMNVSQYLAGEGR